MTRQILSGIMTAMVVGTHVRAQTYSVELEPDTAKRNVILIDQGPVSAELRLTPQMSWKIGGSHIAAQDTFLWYGPYGYAEGSNPQSYLHCYRILKAYSSREYVKVSGNLVKDGPGDGQSPWFRVTVPSADIDWDEYSAEADEAGEDARKVFCPVTSDMSKRRKLIIRNPLDSGRLRDDDSLTGSSPDMVISLNSGYAGCFRLLKADGNVFNTGAFSLSGINSWPLELYVDAIADKPQSDFTITLEGPDGPGGRARDMIMGSTVVNIEMVTPAGDPVDAAREGGDGAVEPSEGANEFTFSSASTGVLKLRLKAKVTPAGAAAYITDSVVFTVGTITGSSMTWASGNEGGKPTAEGDYLKATALFTGLPSANNAFGLKTASVAYQNVKKDEERYEVFYPKNAKNHPGAGTGVSPNWFYYWNQTGAGYWGGDVSYRGDYPTLCGVTPAMRLWFSGMLYSKTQIWICPQAAESTFRYEFNNDKVTGIDCFANTVAHEFWHTIQIEWADQALGALNGKAGSLWVSGWSWNTYRNPEEWNHVTLGIDGKPGQANTDDDNDGIIDEDCDLSEIDFLGFDDEILDVDSNDVPDYWQPYDVEEEARKEETIIEGTFISSDWGKPGKQHGKLGEYDN